MTRGDDEVRIDAVLDAVSDTTDRDGVASLRDTAEEAGEEDEYEDLFTVDDVEAREVGVDLDEVADEPPLS
jgi:hypothetical protein